MAKKNRIISMRIEDEAYDAAMKHKESSDHSDGDVFRRILEAGLASFRMTRNQYPATIVNSK